MADTSHISKLLERERRLATAHTMIAAELGEVRRDLAAIQGGCSHIYEYFGTSSHHRLYRCVNCLTFAEDVEA